MDYVRHQLSQGVIDLLVASLKNYTLVAAKASILIWRLWHLGLASKLVDATAFPSIMPITKLPNALEKRLSNNVKLETADNLKSVAYFVAADKEDKSRPSHYDQHTLVEAHQALLYFLTGYSPKVDGHAILSSITPSSNHQGSLANSLLDVNWDQHKLTLYHLARVETALALARDNVTTVEFGSVEPCSITWGGGEEMEGLRIHCLSAKTTVNTSERQKIIFDVMWLNDLNNLRDCKYSSFSGRVMSVDGQYFTVWFPLTENNYTEHFFNAPVPIPLGDYCRIVQIQTNGPSDPTGEELARYKFLHKVSTVSSNHQKFDPTGLLYGFMPKIVDEQRQAEAIESVKTSFESHKLLYNIEINFDNDVDCNLDKSQRGCICELMEKPKWCNNIEDIMKNGIKFLQGPPGSGKSKTIAYACKLAERSLQRQEEELESDYLYDLSRKERQINYRDNNESMPAGEKPYDLEEFEAKWAGLSPYSTEAIYLLAHNNQTILNLQKALNKIEVEYNVIKGGIYASYNDAAYQAMDGHACFANEAEKRIKERQLAKILLMTTAAFKDLEKNILKARRPVMIWIEESSTLHLQDMPAILFKCGRGQAVRINIVGDKNQNDPFLAEIEGSIRSAYSANVGKEQKLTISYRLPARDTGLIAEFCYHGEFYPSRQKALIEEVFNPPSTLFVDCDPAPVEDEDEVDDGNCTNRRKRKFNNFDFNQHQDQICTNYDEDEEGKKSANAIQKEINAVVHCAQILHVKGLNFCIMTLMEEHRMQVAN